MDSATLVDLIVSIFNPAYIAIAVLLTWFMKNMGPVIYIMIPFIMIVLSIIFDALFNVPTFTVYYVGQVIGIGVVALVVTAIFVKVFKKMQKPS